MSLQTIFCVLIFLDKLYRFTATAYVSSTSTPSCSPVVNAPVCPDGYVETSSPRACLTTSPKKMGPKKAKTHCAKLQPPHSSMWVSYNREMTMHIKELMLLLGNLSSSKRAWIDLTDEKKEGTWLWGNGQKLRNTSANWNFGEPDGGTVQNCVAVKPDTKWIDVSCKDWYAALCMIRHQIGPREIDMSVKYHAPKRGPYIIYSERDVTYTCSAFMQEDDYVFLKIRDKRRTQFNQTFLSMDPRNNSLGMCTNLSAVEITIKNGYSSDSSKVYSNRTFDCYARELDDYDEFTECQNKPMEFCRKFIIPMIILDPPIQNLTLNLTVTTDDVSAICLANVGSTGRLTWVLYFPNATQVLQDGDLHIWEHTRDKVTKNYRWVEKSTLYLPYESVKGIDIGCFDHSITKYNLTTTCEPEDMFCDIKEVEILPAQKQPRLGSHSAEYSTHHYVLGIAMLLFGLTFIVGALLLPVPQTVVSGNNEEAVPFWYYDDAQYYVAEHKRPAYGEEQPAGGKEQLDIVEKLLAYGEEQLANDTEQCETETIELHIIRMSQEAVVPSSVVTIEVPSNAITTDVLSSAFTTDVPGTEV